MVRRTSVLTKNPIRGSSSLRLRPMMIPSVVEKFTFGVALVALVMQGRMHRTDLVFAGTDLTLGVLFVAAYVVTGGEGRAAGFQKGRVVE